jgi:hypothetical protein
MKRILLLGALLGSTLYAQDITGDWHGTISTPTLEFRVVLHIAKAANGFKSTMDSIDQGQLGIAIDSMTFAGSTLKFTVDAAKGTYEGKLGSNGSIDGIWTQGGPYPLKFERGPFKPIVHKPAKPSDIDGAWSGDLKTGGGPEHLTFRILNTADGLTATLENPKKAMIPVAVARNGSKLNLQIKAINAVFEGTLSPDLKTLKGTFKQTGVDIPLELNR